MRVATTYAMADPPTARGMQTELVGYLAREFKKIERTLASGVLSTSGAPSSPTGAGRPGEVRFDSTHVYVCVAPNTWKRAAFDAWEP